MENPGPIDLSKLSNLDLVTLQLNRNDWYVRHARRLLQERFVVGLDVNDARMELMSLLDDLKQPVDRQLRFLWALHSTGGVGDKRLTQLLTHKDEHMRSWAVRLIGEGGAPNEEQLKIIRELAGNGDSRLVRLYVASTFPRFSEAQQWSLAEDLLGDFGYTKDQNLPYMIWYALRPLVESDPVRALDFLAICHDPQVYKNIVRRIASDYDLNSELMPRLITSIITSLEQGQVENARAGVRGIEQALHGLKGIDAPANWALVAESNDAGVVEEAEKIVAGL